MFLNPSRKFIFKISNLFLDIINGSLNENFRNTQQNSKAQFDHGFLPPQTNNIMNQNTNTLGHFDKPIMNSKSDYESITDIHSKMMTERENIYGNVESNKNIQSEVYNASMIQSNRPAPPIPDFKDSQKMVNENISISQAYEKMMQERGIPKIIPNKSENIPQNTSQYPPNNNIDVVKPEVQENSLPCPEGQVSPPNSNINIGKYIRQQSIQNDDLSNFDNSNKITSENFSFE